MLYKKVSNVILVIIVYVPDVSIIFFFKKKPAKLCKVAYSPHPAFAPVRRGANPIFYLFSRSNKNNRPPRYPLLVAICSSSHR